MAGGEQNQEGRDLAGGIPLAELPEGEPVAGRVGEDTVVLVRRGDQVHAIGGTCTHYGGPLAEGLVVEDTIRCPWHHACFSLRTGEALAAPALNPVPRWDTTIRAGVVHLSARQESEALESHGRTGTTSEPVVIVGAGAAGSAAAEMLRREGFAGRIVMVDPDPDAPCDRPNLSKDYLAGAAPEEWLYLRPSDFYGQHGIERLLDRVVGLDRERGVVRLESGSELSYGSLLLATGAMPRRLDVPGADRPHVFVLRTVEDCRRIIEAAGRARSVAIAGAGFIGMEAAASLKARGLGVTVVAPNAVPFARALGEEAGAELWRVHEEHGVDFRLGQTLAAIESDHVVLDDGTKVAADLVLIGVGVNPATSLAEAAGLRVENGIVVNAHLRTDDPRIWAAGDVANFPDPRTGERTRVEHWVVAQRQGQAAARSILGRDEPYRDVPFFWTRQFDTGLSYVGHAKSWDRVLVVGDPRAGDAEFHYVRAGRLLAVATIGRDQASLRAEATMAEEALDGSAAGGR